MRRWFGLLGDWYIPFLNTAPHRHECTQIRFRELTVRLRRTEAKETARATLNIDSKIRTNPAKSVKGRLRGISGPDENSKYLCVLSVSRHLVTPEHTREYITRPLDRSHTTLNRRYSGNHYGQIQY